MDDEEVEEKEFKMDDDGDVLDEPLDIPELEDDPEDRYH